MTRILLAFLVVAASAQTVKYTYDASGRLTGADYGGTGYLYTYDKNGNLLKRESPAAGFASLSSASFAVGAPLAPELITTGFGSGIASAIAYADRIPWPTVVGGVRIDVTDSRGQKRPAPIYSVAPGQASYLVPAGTAPGRATVAVTTFAGTTLNGTLDINAVAPGIYAANETGRGVAWASYLRVAANGARTDGLIYDPATRAAVPVDLAPAGSQLFLLLYGTGIRGTTGTVTATVGGRNVPVLGAVAHSTFPGLDQVNIGPLPQSLAGSGAVDIVITVDGKQANAVTVTLR